MPVYDEKFSVNVYKIVVVSPLVVTGPTSFTPASDVATLDFSFRPVLAILRGTVVDYITRKQIANAKITVTNTTDSKSLCTTTTTEAINWQLPNVELGSYGIKVEPPPTHSVYSSSPVANDNVPIIKITKAATVSVNFVLMPLEFVVNVSQVDNEGKATQWPVVCTITNGNGTVTLPSASRYSIAFTNKSCSFELTLPQEWATVSVTPSTWAKLPAWTIETKKVTASEYNVKFVSKKLMSPICTGKIISNDGVGVRDINVQFNWEQLTLNTITNANGEWRITSNGSEPLPTGKCRIVCNLPDSLAIVKSVPKTNLLDILWDVVTDYQLTVIVASSATLKISCNVDLLTKVTLTDGTEFIGTNNFVFRSLPVKSVVPSVLLPFDWKVLSMSPPQKSIYAVGDCTSTFVVAPMVCRIDCSATVNGTVLNGAVVTLIDRDTKVEVKKTILTSKISFDVVRDKTYTVCIAVPNTFSLDVSSGRECETIATKPDTIYTVNWKANLISVDPILYGKALFENTPVENVSISVTTKAVGVADETVSTQSKQDGSWSVFCKYKPNSVTTVKASLAYGDYYVARIEPSTFSSLMCNTKTACNIVIAKLSGLVKIVLAGLQEAMAVSFSITGDDNVTLVKKSLTVLVPTVEYSLPYGVYSLTFSLQGYTVPVSLPLQVVVASAKTSINLTATKVITDYVISGSVALRTGANVVYLENILVLCTMTDAEGKKTVVTKPTRLPVSNSTNMFSFSANVANSYEITLDLFGLPYMVAVGCDASFVFPVNCAKAEFVNFILVPR